MAIYAGFTLLKLNLMLTYFNDFDLIWKSV